ncbi:MAG: hypothetical protein WCJ84_01795 [Candidatus Peregrinibacteria bacterium]
MKSFSITPTAFSFFWCTLTVFFCTVAFAVPSLAIGETPSSFKIQANNHSYNISLSSVLSTSPIHFFYNGKVYAVLIGPVTHTNATPIHVFINGHTYALLSSPSPSCNIISSCQFWTNSNTAGNQNKIGSCFINTTLASSCAPTPTITPSGNCQIWDEVSAPAQQNKADFCTIGI